MEKKRSDEVKKAENMWRFKMSEVVRKKTMTLRIRSLICKELKCFVFTDFIAAVV